MAKKPKQSAVWDQNSVDQLLNMYLDNKPLKDMQKLLKTSTRKIKDIINQIATGQMKYTVGSNRPYRARKPFTLREERLMDDMDFHGLPWENIAMVVRRDSQQVWKKMKEIIADRNIINSRNGSMKKQLEEQKITNLVESKEEPKRFKPGSKVYVDPDTQEPCSIYEPTPNNAELWTADENGILRPPGGVIETEVKKEESIATPITEHEGRKYLRTIYAATLSLPSIRGDLYGVEVDVYAVLEAFGITCPATAHAIKKLLCGGQRGKGSRLEDLKGALAAINRAIQLEENR